MTSGRGILVFAVLLLALSGCDRAERGGPTTAPAADSLSVLLVTLDTTRADRLGCYGYAGARTPTIDALAAAGVRCARAYCQVPLTLPSHVSLLTGTHPPTTGVHVNAGGIVNRNLPTLAELFKVRGYRTGAFVAAWVLHSTFGLNRGFDVYDERFGAGGDSGQHQERPADAVADAALAWLAADPAQPFFAWVHFFDPHSPYAPPADYTLPDPYDGEIAFMDAQLGRLVEWLQTTGLERKTLVILAGDHGEAFGEHGEREHGLFLYDTTMHVPLVFTGPGRLPAGKVVQTGMRLVDIAPTVLDLLGWEAPETHEGVSLRAALETGEFAALPAYGETHYPQVAFGWAPLRSYTTGEWKFIEAPRPELYQLPHDPAETTNLHDSRAEIVTRLRTALADLTATFVARTPERVPLTDETIRKLEGLGYVGVGQAAAATRPASELRDPKDMVAVATGLMRAKALLAGRQYGAVVELLGPLAEQSPESDELRATLGEALLRLGRAGEAERELAAGLRTVPTNAHRLCLLGDALALQRRVPEALQCYELALKSAESYAPAHNRLGAVYLDQQQFAKAAAHFKRLLELEPESSGALTNYAAVLLRTGKPADALPLLRQAVARDPANASAQQYFCHTLLALQRRDEALSALQAATAALPRDYNLKRMLAGLLAATPGSAGEAVRLARECCAGAPQSAESFDVLGIALAAAGDLAGARQAAQQALQLAQSQGRTDLAAQVAARLQSYER